MSLALATRGRLCAGAALSLATRGRACAVEAAVLSDATFAGNLCLSGTQSRLTLADIRHSVRLDSGRHSSRISSGQHSTRMRTIDLPVVAPSPPVPFSSSLLVAGNSATYSLSASPLEFDTEHLNLGSIVLGDPQFTLPVGQALIILSPAADLSPFANVSSIFLRDVTGSDAEVPQSRVLPWSPGSGAATHGGASTLVRPVLRPTANVYELRSGEATFIALRQEATLMVVELEEAHWVQAGLASNKVISFEEQAITWDAVDNETVGSDAAISGSELILQPGVWVVFASLKMFQLPGGARTRDMRLRNVTDDEEVDGSLIRLFNAVAPAGSGGCGLMVLPINVTAATAYEVQLDVVAGTTEFQSPYTHLTAVKMGGAFAQIGLIANQALPAIDGTVVLLDVLERTFGSAIVFDGSGVLRFTEPGRYLLFGIISLAHPSGGVGRFFTFEEVGVGDIPPRNLVFNAVVGTNAGGGQLLMAAVEHPTGPDASYRITLDHPFSTTVRRDTSHFIAIKVS